MQDFKKVLGRWDSVAVIIAIVIGVGIFRVPAEVAKYLSSPNLIILAWILGGIISLLGALCYAELSSSFPKTGGNYVYFRESYGLGTAFLFGWTELLVIRTGSIAAVAFIFAEYLQSFLYLDKYWIKTIAVAIILILSFVNILGLRYGKRVQNISVITKVLALIAIILFGFLSKKGNISNFHSAPIFFDAVSSLNGIGISPLKGIGKTFSLFGLALIPILWTYGGWHENTFVAGETKNAGKSIPFALIVGITIVITLYLGMNLLYIYLVPLKEIVDTNLIASNVMQILYGRGGGKALEALVIISSLGCINGMIMTGSRVTYAMAKENTVFRHIGEINAKYRTPQRAIIINALWAAVLVILGTFNKLLFFSGALVWLFFALAGGGIFILRHKFPHIERPYKVWGYPLVPAIFILICIALFINTVIFYPFPSLIGLALALTGIPIFIISRKKRNISTG